VKYYRVIFYLHAIIGKNLLFKLLFSYGSLACLPIIETLSHDLSAYIATNIISITDGQLYLEAILFGHGIYPAISLEKVFFVFELNLWIVFDIQFHLEFTV
jgi:F-type H+-transporting ATPase subunit alpha